MVKKLVYRGRMGDGRPYVDPCLVEYTTVPEKDSVLHICMYTSCIEVRNMAGNQKGIPIDLLTF